MKTAERIFAEKLLHIKAVMVQPHNPFLWAQGWKAPMYNDHRKTLSYPALRSFIKVELARVIQRTSASSTPLPASPPAPSPREPSWPTC